MLFWCEWTLWLVRVEKYDPLHWKDFKTFIYLEVTVILTVFQTGFLVCASKPHW